ncbi:MAG: FAD:protein FMN transferase [Saprospiraceae bacterium]|nr:FAD:protein FMN transferase [Saprospiraceae bacterium]
MKEFAVEQKLMGSAFKLAVVANDEGFARRQLDLGIGEISRIENLLSEFKPNSTTSRLNAKAGSQPVEVEQECFDLLERCLQISRLSRGCFDITVSPLKKLYDFKNGNFDFPTQSRIDDARQAVGYEKIQLDRTSLSVRFLHPDLKLGFAAIGKGYAADRVKQLWKGQGVQSGYVNASGDLSAFGTRPDGGPWKIGIANPDDQSSALFYVPLDHASAATSGDYEQFFMYQNKRYSHNINPITGFPLSGLKSVTIFSPSAELSDALATAVYVMGASAGISFVNELPRTHCVMIDDRNGIHFSKHLKYEKSK